MLSYYSCNLWKEQRLKTMACETANLLKSEKVFEIMPKYDLKKIQASYAPGYTIVAKYEANKATLWDLIAATVLVISNWIQIVNFSAHAAVKFDGWPRKTIGHFFYTTSGFVQYFKYIGEFKLDLQSINAEFRSKLVICYPVWPWNLIDDLGKQ